jgi:hypothetical protein
MRREGDIPETEKRVWEFYCTKQTAFCAMLLVNDFAAICSSHDHSLCQRTGN